MCKPIEVNAEKCCGLEPSYIWCKDDEYEYKISCSNCGTIVTSKGQKGCVKRWDKIVKGKK